MKRKAASTAKDKARRRCLGTARHGCAHYWLIDDRNVGVCKYCGRVKKFPGGGDIETFMLPGPGRYNWRRKPGKKRSGLAT